MKVCSPRIVTTPSLPSLKLPPMGMIVKVTNAGTSIRNGASLNTNRSAFSGIRSSFRISFMPSATVWNRPKGPARLGPMRFCMSAMILRSNQTIRITETSRPAKATTTLMSTIRISSRPMPPESSGSVPRMSGVMSSPPPGCRTRRRSRRSADRRPRRRGRDGSTAVPLGTPASTTAGTESDPCEDDTVTRVPVVMPTGAASAVLSRTVASGASPAELSQCEMELPAS